MPASNLADLAIARCPRCERGWGEECSKKKVGSCLPRSGYSPLVLLGGFFFGLFCLLKNSHERLHFSSLARLMRVFLSCH